MAVSDRSRSASAAQVGSGGEAAAGLVAIATFLDGCSIEQLSRTLGLSHSASVRLVDKLQARKLVRRVSGTDKRSAALVATARGRRRCGEVLAARERELERMLEPLTEGERAELTRLHEKLLAGLVEEGIAPARICRLCDAEACGHELGRCPVTEAGQSLRA